MLPRSLIPFVPFVLVVAAAASAADMARLLPHEGRLLRADGTPERSVLPLVFKLYEAADSGAATWTETLAVTPSESGYYAVLLGSLAVLPPFDGRAYWLGVSVQGEPEMRPRARLAAAPYALHAQTAADAAKLGGSAATEYIRKPHYCGVTGSFNGNLGGYPGAAAKCAALASCNAATAHICATEELHRVVREGVVIPLATYGWYATGMRWDTGSYQNNDCNSWTQAGVNYAAAAWYTAQVATWDTCNVLHPLICCD